jgi:hypothetical protein
MCVWEISRVSQLHSGRRAWLTIFRAGKGINAGARGIEDHFSAEIVAEAHNHAQVYGSKVGAETVVTLVVVVCEEVTVWILRRV